MLKINCYRNGCVHWAESWGCIHIGMAVCVVSGRL